MSIASAQENGQSEPLSMSGQSIMQAAETNGKSLSRARELAEMYLKATEVTRRDTRIHFIQPLKEQIVGEVGYALALEGASASDVAKAMQAQNESVSRSGVGLNPCFIQLPASSS